MSSLISCAASSHSLALPVLAADPGQLGAAVDRHPAHDLGGGEVLQLAADLPDAGVGFPPVLQRLVDLLVQDRPDPAVEMVGGLGVQVDRVEQGTPDVVLLLAVRGVADPHRPGVGVARAGDRARTPPAPRSPPMPYMICRWSSRSATSAMKEKKSSASQSKPSEYKPHKGERGVPDPGVAVVVVALATRGLRQRGGAGRGDRTGRRVGQALQGQRAALQVGPPRVVGELAAGQPVLPVVGGPDLLACTPPRRSAAAARRPRTARCSGCRPA